MSAVIYNKNLNFGPSINSSRIGSATEPDSLKRYLDATVYA